MSFIPKPHEIYKHFKGNLYQVTAIAEHTETGEQLVIYQALYGDFKAYARPLAMFVSRVDREKYPDAEQEFRFQLQGPEAARQETESEPEEISEPEESFASRQPAGRESVSESRQSILEKDMGAEEGDSVREGAADREEPALDPMLLEFLDSDSYEQKLNILAGLHHRITDEMLTTMAIACDIEINDGETEERYEALRACLLTLERYECNRLR